MIKIPLTKGQYALIDNEDFKSVNKYKWNAAKDDGDLFYARNRKFRMHRFILKAPKHLVVDHIDGNGLNNQKSNLRLCTQKENMRNLKIFKDNTSGFKGVSLDKRSGKWRVRICLNGVDRFIGRFDDITEAAQAYDKSAIELFGQFAKLNFGDT